MAKKNIVFVCHSTGGIVARHMLYHHREFFKDKNVGLVLIASPSYGSRFADRLSLLADFYNNQLGKQLQWKSEFIRELDRNFKNMVESKLIPNLIGIEALEHHFIIHSKPIPDNMVVVEEESGGRYFGDPIRLPKTDHFTAVKPDSGEHPAYLLLVDFWTTKLKPNLLGGLPQAHKVESQTVRLNYDVAVVRMFNPVEHSTVSEMNDKFEPYPGIPYYSHESDHPSFWPPRVYRDRTEFMEKVTAFLNRADIKSSITSAGKKFKPSVQIQGQEILALYASLRIFRKDNNYDDKVLSDTFGEVFAKGFREVENERADISRHLPNRLMILRLDNKYEANAEDFRVEIDAGGSIYDVTLNNEQGHAKSLKWSPNHLIIEIGKFSPSYRAEIRVWYRYRELGERFFTYPANVEWEKTQGIRIRNLVVSNGRVLKDSSLLHDLDAYEKYNVDPVHWESPQ